MALPKFTQICASIKGAQPCFCKYRLGSWRGHCVQWQVSLLASFAQALTSFRGSRTSRIHHPKLISHAIASPESQCHCQSWGIVLVASGVPVAPAVSFCPSSPFLSLGITALLPTCLFFSITLSAWWSLARLIAILPPLPSSMAVQLLHSETVTQQQQLCKQTHQHWYSSIALCGCGVEIYQNMCSLSAFFVPQYSQIGCSALVRAGLSCRDVPAPSSLVPPLFPPLCGLSGFSQAHLPCVPSALHERHARLWQAAFK